MANEQVVTRRNWLPKVVVIGIACFNIGCSVLWLVARFLWARSSIHVSVTTDQMYTSALYFMLHFDFSSGAILDIVTFVVAALFLVAALKKWMAVIGFWILFTMTKGIFELVFVWTYCDAETSAKAQKTTICLGGSPGIAIMLSYVNMLCAVSVIVSLWTKEKSASGRRPVLLDRRSEANDCPPTYEDATLRLPPSLFVSGSNETNSADEAPPPSYTAVQIVGDHIQS